MGIVKLLDKVYTRKSDLDNLIQYIARESNGLQGQVFGGYGVSVFHPNEVSKQFTQVLKYFGFTRTETLCYHLVLSFATTDSLRYCFDYCTDYSLSRGELGWQSFFAIHSDKNGIHAHFVFCPVNFRTGQWMDINYRELAHLRNKMDEEDE